jgi:hypothetical protein
MNTETSTFLARAAAVEELAELKRVVDALDRAAIRNLICKGAAVAVSHYPSLHLRPHIDIDIWIDLRDRRRAQKILEDMGYRAEGDASPPELQRQFALRRHVHADLEVVLDVHLHLSNADAFAGLLAFDEAWARGKVLVAGGARFKTLCDADALILACIHPVMHHYSGDEEHLYRDILVLFGRMAEEDRMSFFKRIRELKISRLCLKSLTKAGWSGSAPFPRSRGRFEPLALYPLLAKGFWGQLAADILLAPPSLFALRRLWHALFPPADYMRLWAARAGANSGRNGLWSLYWRRLSGRRPD